MKRLKYKFKLYRRLLLDVWGLIFSSDFRLNKLTGLLYSTFLVRSGTRISKEMARFLWLSCSVNSFKPRYHKFLSLYLLRLFYFGVQRKYFNKLVVLASRREGFLVESFLVLLEFRLSSVLYRSFFFFDIIGMKRFLQVLPVFVNKKRIVWVNYMLHIGDLVHLLPSDWLNLRHGIFLRLRADRFYCNIPSYMFVSFIFMFVLLIRLPRYEDINYPVGLDIYRCMDLF